MHSGGAYASINFLSGARNYLDPKQRLTLDVPLGSLTEMRDGQKDGGLLTNSPEASEIYLQSYTVCLDFCYNL